MERLTERDEFGNADIIGVDSEDLQLHLTYYEFNLVTSALNRLAAYEDTGLEPEEVAEVYQRFREAHAIAKMLGKKYAERADELMQADREGRLVVLPCKVGDTVYYTQGVGIYPKTVTGYRELLRDNVLDRWYTVEYSQDETFELNNIGKTIFLTREAAEAALAERLAFGDGKGA